MHSRHLILAVALLLIAVGALGQTSQQRQDVVKRVQIQHLNWSSDGKSILFSANIVKSDWSDYNQERWALYEVDTETKQIVQVSTSSLYGAYSPDNTEIALSKIIDGNWEVIRLTRVTKAERRLTNHTARDMAPFWSPDSKQLVFMSERDSLMEVYTTDRDGDDVRRLTYSKGFKSYNPEWSPDGTKIVYYLEKGDGMDQLHVATLSNNSDVAITNDDFNNIFPGWTASGDIIYSAGKKQQPTVVRVISSEGASKAAPIIESFYARFSPDGSRIAYINEKEGCIYLADQQGDSPQKLVDGDLFLKMFNR